MREEIIGDCRLILGDCRDVLPGLKVSALALTDPPYGIKRSGQAGMISYSRGRKNTRTRHEEKGWDDKSISSYEIELIRSISINQIIWGGNYIADLLNPTSQWIIWDKGQDSLSQGSGELAWTSGSGAIRTYRINRCEIGQDSHVWRGPSYHPTQKPVALMSACLNVFAQTDSVIDPFMGSGTTGVACVQDGRAFIGIERELSYFDTACRRIEAAYKQPRLFAEPVAKPVQKSLI